MKHKHTRSLYEVGAKKMPLRIKFALALSATLLPVAATLSQGGEKQDFIITAYYSPQPQQCCYVKGSFQADKMLNGNGTHGADGTQVYPGMLAAPSTYAFGTVVDLPGIGVLTVHDRGGAIGELSNDVHRLDIWVGEGEEGLARALAFGVVHIQGTVYSPGMGPKEHINLKAIPAPLDKLEAWKIPGINLMSIAPETGEYGLSVAMLQQVLAEVGEFKHPVTGVFGAVTADALASFQRKYGLPVRTDTLTPEAAAHLLAARAQASAPPALRKHVEKGSAPSTIATAQRLLRFLGFYKGRTTGDYDDVTKAGIMAFQRSVGLIADAASTGAGRIGPKTLASLQQAIMAERVDAIADRYLLKQQVAKRLQDKSKLVSHFLRQGDNGADVTQLQTLLADRGFFPAEKINGNYGEITAAAVLSFQLDRKVIGSKRDAGAGTLGPATLDALSREQIQQAYAVVRAKGLKAL